MSETSSRAKEAIAWNLSSATDSRHTYSSGKQQRTCAATTPDPPFSTEGFPVSECHYSWNSLGWHLPLSVPSYPLLHISLLSPLFVYREVKLPSISSSALADHTPLSALVTLYSFQYTSNERGIKRRGRNLNLSWVRSQRWLLLTPGTNFADFKQMSCFLSLFLLLRCFLHP